MQTLKSRRVLEHYMEQYGLNDYFSVCQPDLLLFRYRPGEFLTSPFSPSDYFQFVVEGSLRLYSMMDEGTSFSYEPTRSEVMVIGEMEFINRQFTPFFVEAETEVVTVALHIGRYRDELMQDPAFLGKLCFSLAKKLETASETTRELSLSERVENMLGRMEPGQELREIGRLAEQMNVSRRQMIRVLQDCCTEGKLRHENKGVYTKV